MQVNEKLKDILRGRTIEVVSKEEGLAKVLFSDRSTMELKIVGGPTVNILREGRMESVEENGAEVVLFGENDRRAVLRVAAPGSSIIVKDKDGIVEYTG
jgi:hypothetical protein